MIIIVLEGSILGAITEYALILEIDWLIDITQSLIFWTIITILIVTFSKGYILSIVNPILALLVMNATYYLIRYMMSGYTNVGGWLYWFNYMAIIAGAYIGSIVYCFKNMKNSIVLQMI